MNDVIEYFQTEITEAQARQIVALTNKVWPDSQKTIDQRLQFILGSSESEAPEERESLRFVVWENGVAIAHARTFRRTVYVGDRALDVLALAGVCTDDTARGRGLGALVVKKAFEQVDRQEFEFSLFQTGVPEFYKKLNCQLIQNKIIDRTNFADPENNPFWDRFVMTYPADQVWPEGVVDLNGKGY